MLLSRQLEWEVEEGRRGGVAGASLAKGEFPADRFFHAAAVAVAMF